jgi:hypothetical protein
MVEPNGKLIVKLDGVRLMVEAPDLDGDGVTGGIEQVTQSMAHDITTVQQPSELGDSLKELNTDAIQEGTRMSGIDLRSNLHPVEVPSILAIDTLIALRFLPTNCVDFTRQKKRLSVSLLGRGRDDIVKIVSGKREHDEKTQGSMFDKAKGFLGMGGS